MLQDGGNLTNKRQNKTEVSREVNTSLLKRVSDQALLFTARSPVYAPHLGESSSRLARFLAERVGLTFIASRAIRLPLLSRAFDYIRGKTSFVSPVWQRMLDLPWVQQHRKPKHRITKTTSAAATGMLINTVGLQQNELYPDTLLQTVSGAKEEPVSNEVDEPYVLATDETYPSLISNNLLLPSMARKRLLTTGDLPHAADDTTLSLHTRKIADRQYPNVPSAPGVMESVSGTTHKEYSYACPTTMPIGVKQTENRLETESDSELIPGHLGQGAVSISQPLSWALTQVQRFAQRLARKSVSVEERSHITRGKVPETRAFPQKHSSHQAVELKVDPDSKITKTPGLPFLATIPKIRASDQPDIESINTPLKLAGYKQPDTSDHRSSLDVLPGQSGPAIPGDAFRRPGPSIIPRIVRHPSEITSNTLLPEKLAYGEGAMVLPDSASRQWAPKVGQPQRQKPVVGPNMEPTGEQTRIISQAESVTDISQRADKLNLISLEHGGIGQSLTKGLMNKPSLYGEPSSLAARPIKELPVPESTRHTMILPYQQIFRSEFYAPPSDRSESDTSLEKQEYVSSIPNYKYTSQPALDFPLVSSIQPKAESSPAHAEELFTDISNTIPAYSRNQNVPEVALATVSRTVESSPRPIVPEWQFGESEEKVAKPDIDAIACDVYRILKQRLINERERTLGVR